MRVVSTLTQRLDPISWNAQHFAYAPMQNPGILITLILAILQRLSDGDLGDDR